MVEIVVERVLHGRRGLGTFLTALFFLCRRRMSRRQRLGEKERERKREKEKEKEREAAPAHGLRITTLRSPSPYFEPVGSPRRAADSGKVALFFSFLGVYCPLVALCQREE